MPGVTFNIYNSDLNQIIIEKYNIEYAIRKMAELGFQTQNLKASDLAADWHTKCANVSTNSFVFNLFTTLKIDIFLIYIHFIESRRYD